MSDDFILIVQLPSRIPNSYIPPLGLPLNWKRETSGELPNAVFKYYGRLPLSPDEISLLAEYCQYFINAPCWDATGGFTDELAALRESSRSITAVEDIGRWIMDCLEIALDPLKKKTHQLKC